MCFLSLYYTVVINAVPISLSNQNGTLIVFYNLYRQSCQVFSFNRMMTEKSYTSSAMILFTRSLFMQDMEIKWATHFSHQWFSYILHAANYLA